MACDRERDVGNRRNVRVLNAAGPSCPGHCAQIGVLLSQSDHDNAPAGSPSTPGVVDLESDDVVGRGGGKLTIGVRGHSLCHPQLAARAYAARGASHRPSGLSAGRPGHQAGLTGAPTTSPHGRQVGGRLSAKVPKTDGRDIEGVPRVAKPGIDHAALDGSAVEAARADDAPVAGPGGGYRGRGRSARRMWVVLDVRVRDAGADYVRDAGGLHAGRCSRLVRASACRHRRHQAGHQFHEHRSPECADPGPSSQPECVGTVQAAGGRASVRDQQPRERPAQPGQFAESTGGRADPERGHAGNNCHPEPCFRAVVHLPGRRGNGRADRDERLAQLSSAARRLVGPADTGVRC